MWGTTAQGNPPTTWSPLNVPAMSFPLHPVDFHEGSEDANASTAVRHGWVALREGMRAWGIEDADGLSNWLGSQGFPGVHLETTSQPEERSSFCTKPHLVHERFMSVANEPDFAALSG